jgi:hypothetical protein
MEALENQDYNCPFCSAVNSLEIDRSGGHHQTYITDCETCCRPIQIELTVESNGFVSFVAKREGEG